jgi:hypothetical protein
MHDVRRGQADASLKKSCVSWLSVWVRSSAGLIASVSQSVRAVPSQVRDLERLIEHGVGAFAQDDPERELPARLGGATSAADQSISMARDHIA